MWKAVFPYATPSIEFTYSFSVKVWKNDRTTDIIRRNLRAIATRLKQYPVNVSSYCVQAEKILLADCI